MTSPRQKAHPQHSPLARLFCALLGLSFLLPSGISPVHSRSAQFSEDFYSQATALSQAPALALLQATPQFEELKNSPPLPGPPSLESDDPLLDQDPFFLRSQRWTKSNASQEALSFRKESNGSLVLSLGKNIAELQISPQITPQLQTDEFLVFSVDEHSKLFQEKTPDGQTQGLFFLDLRELYRAAQVRTPVAFYFLPLSMENWMGNLNASTLGQEQILIENSEGDTKLLDVEDLRQIRELSRQNLFWGAYLAAEDFGKGLVAGKTELLLPARGSTLSFGLVFSGINLDNPNASLSGMNPQALPRILQEALEALLPSAHADLHAEALSTLLEKMATFTSLMGGAFVVSLAAKYCIKSLRQDIERNRKLREESKTAEVAKPQTAPTSIWGLAWQDFKQRYLTPAKTIVAAHIPQPVKIAWREFVEANDVLVHGLYANWQIPIVLFPDILEFLQDRLLPSVTAADNTLARRVQNWTTNFVRRINMGGKVNARTLALAGVLMGIVGTVSSYVQFAWIIPAICAGIAPYLWDGAQERIASRFQSGSDATINYVVNSTYRSFYSWMMGGPAGFVAESRSQIELFLKSEVQTQMRKEGKNPHAPENAEEFESLVKTRLNEMLAVLGLPRDEEFLFDLRSIERSVQRKMGYTGDLDRDKRDPDRLIYLGEERPGLVLGSLSRAINIAHSRLNSGRGDPETQQKALEILKDLKKNLSLLNTSSVTSPLKQAQLRRTLKHVLTSLTFTGPPAHHIEEHTPKDWVATSGKEAAVEASYIYRKAFLSLLHGNQDLVEISATHLERFGPEARRRARLLAQEQGLSATSEERLFESLIHQSIFEEGVDRELEKFKPLPKDSLAEKQRQRALAKTMIDVEKLKAQKEGLGQAPVVNHKDFSKLYAHHFAHEVGIHILPEEDIDEEEIRDLYSAVHLKSQNLTREELKHNKALRSYMQALPSPHEKQAFLAYQYARNFIQFYKEATVDTNQVRPHSPAQPGVTQKIRQTDLVKRSKVLTGFLRFFDSFFGTEVGYQPGRLAWFYRNWPGFLGGYDFTSSMERTVRFFPSVVAFRWPYLLLWGMNYPIETYLLIGAFNFTFLLPSQWVKRVSSQNGLEPTGNVKSAVSYSLLYSWTSFLGNIPIMLLNPDKASAPKEPQGLSSAQELPESCQANLK